MSIIRLLSCVTVPSTFFLALGISVAELGKEYEGTKKVPDLIWEDPSLGLSVRNSALKDTIEYREQSIDPLRLAESYSLELEGLDARAGSGYFSLGFVHGDPEQRAQLGAAHEQDTQINPAFVFGEPALIPHHKANPYHTKFFSCAWAYHPLTSVINSRQDFKINTKYGLISAQLDPWGMVPKGKAKPNYYQQAVKDYLLEYVREHVKSRLESPIGRHVVQWGLDNEWEGTPDYSPEARKTFALWLEQTYDRRIDGLNEAWNTAYRNFEDAAFGSLPTATKFRENPGKFLDWWSFQSQYFVELLASMGRQMYHADPQKRGVMHKSTQQSIEMPVVNRERTFDQERFAELMRPISGGLLGCDVYGAGDREMYEVNYLFNCIRPEDRKPGYGVFLAELNNHSGPGHQLASTIWPLLANGLKGADFFTMGWAGATHDWDSFGFVNAKTGEPKDKLFYASRWIHTVQRAEAFWTEAVPAPNLPRVAMLMPRRDVLLSEPKNAGERWGYPENHRWMVYRWLRERGYWVDVIPATKLTRNYLKEYQALFLVGAEHLSTSESSAITAFVQNGGTLVADTRPGHFDEHHRERRLLEPLIGVEVSGYDNSEFISIPALGLQGKGFVSVKPITAAPAKRWGKVVVYANRSGKGKILYLPFALGSLASGRLEAKKDFTPDGPTAETEEYVAGQDEFVVSAWLQSLLKDAELLPAFQLSTEDRRVLGKIRVEQPMTDRSGNMALVVANRAQNRGADNEPIQEIIPSFNLTVTVPAGASWTSALWAPAEGDGFIELPVKMSANRCSVRIPSMPTAGILYFFKNRPPLVGIEILKDDLSVSADQISPKVKPGVPFKSVVTIFNTSGKSLESGKLTFQALRPWKVEPAEIPITTIKAGGKKEYVFVVTPPAEEENLKSNWLYPLLAHLNDGTRKIALSASSVEVDIPEEKAVRLLSNNTGFPKNWSQRISTGARYRYLRPSASHIADPRQKGAVENTALQSGRSFKGFSGDHVARYSAEEVDIEFDLQSAYNVSYITLTRDGLVLPKSVMILASEDGVDYSVASAQDFTPDAPSPMKIELAGFKVRARYIRLKVIWPTIGGALAGIEIWGK